MLFFSFFFYSSSMTKGTPDNVTGALCKGSQRELDIARLVCHLCLGFTQKFTLGESAQRLSPYKLLALDSLQCQESTGPLPFLLVTQQTHARGAYLLLNYRLGLRCLSWS